MRYDDQIWAAIEPIVHLELRLACVQQRLLDLFAVLSGFTQSYKCPKPLGRFASLPSTKLHTYRMYVLP